MNNSSLTFEKRIIFLFLCLGNITISFNIGAVAASIPTISHDLGLSDFVVAKIVPFYMIPYGIGALLYAYLTRWFFYRHIMIAALGFYALMSFLSGMSQSLPLLLIAQVGAGIAAASSTPLSLMIIGDLFDKDIRGRLVGGYFGASFFASLVGMIFMGIVSWRWLFFIPAAIGTVSVLCLLFYKMDLLNRKHKEDVNFFKVFSDAPIRSVFAFVFVMSFLYHALHKWYGVYLHREYGMDVAGISFFLILAASCGLIGQQVGGFLSDKKGRYASCQIGMGILFAGTIILSFHVPILIVPLVLGMIAMGWTISHNSISTTLTDFPNEDRPMIASLNSSVRFVSGGLGFSLSKFFVEKSFSLTFLGIGIILAFMTLFIKKIIAKQ